MKISSAKLTPFILAGATIVIILASVMVNQQPKTKEIVTGDTDWTQFSGLPANIDTETAATTFGSHLISPDKTEAIVTVSTLDKTQGISDFGGDYPVKSQADYICVIATKACTKTSILSEAKEAASKNFGISSDQYTGWVNTWNPTRHELLGHPAGEGVEFMNVEIVYHYDTKKIDKTTDVSINSSPAFFSPALNATLNRVAIISTPKNGAPVQVFIYDISDLSKPLQTLLVEDGLSITSWKTISWADDKNIIITTANKIFKLNLSTEE